MKFVEKVAVVTGGAGAGIGQAVARALAREGASVVVSDAHAKRAIAVADDIKFAFGAETLGIQCDVSDRDQVELMVKRTLETFRKIDILVNNAGINRLSPVISMTDETWDLVINVNLKGTFYCSRAALPSMIQNKWGRVINIASIVAWLGEGDGQAHYAAAKAGIIAFTKALALEVAQHNITVNAIAPGLIWNEFLGRVYSEEALQAMKNRIPLGRVGVPEDAAAVVLFLASDEAAFITGETLCLSGGRYMRS